MGLTRFRPYSYQRKLLADRSTARLILKARQTGISQTFAVETAHTAIYQPKSTILWLSKDEGAAAQVLSYVKTILHGLKVPLNRDAETFVRLENDSRILSLAASPGSGRSYAATAVYLDEFAYAHYAQEIYQSVLPSISHGGRITVISTPNGQGNLFFLLWSGRAHGDWSRHAIHWRECPAYSEKWYQSSRGRFTGAQWASEYELDFARSGSARFSPDDIERAHQDALGLSPAVPGQHYFTAWDIGRRHDATVGVTITTEVPFQLVAFEHLDGHSYPAIQHAIMKRAKQYPGRVRVESNGIGDPVIENLDINVDAWNTTAKSKLQMLDALSLAMENGVLKWDGLEQLDTEMLLYQDDDRELVQDCVMALAMAIEEFYSHRIPTSAQMAIYAAVAPLSEQELAPDMQAYYVASLDKITKEIVIQSIPSGPKQSVAQTSYAELRKQWEKR